MDSRPYAFLTDQAHSTLLQRAVDAMDHSSRGPVEAPLSAMQSGMSAYIQDGSPVRPVLVYSACQRAGIGWDLDLNLMVQSCIHQKSGLRPCLLQAQSTSCTQRKTL